MRYFLNRISTFCFILFFGFFIVISNVQAAPSGSISSSASTCSFFPCSVTISWSSTDPDLEGVTAIISSGLNCGSPTTTLGTSLSGSQSTNLPSVSTVCLFIGDSMISSTSISQGSAPAATPTPTNPTPTPYPNYRACNAACGNNNECSPGLGCINGLCRLPSNPSDSSCNAPSYGGSSSPAPTATPTPRPQVVASNFRVSTPTPTPVVTEEIAVVSTPSAEILGDSLTPTPTPTPGFFDILTSNPLVGASVGILSALVIGLIGYKIFAKTPKRY